MTFLNTSLLLGTIAFAIPLIIHLLNKRKYREVRWGATHLLHEVVKKNHRRMRLEQLLLLLLRIGIPLLLALLMAKPVLTRSIKWLQDERISTLFLLDNSYSMQAVDDQGVTRFEQGQQALQSIIESLHDGSDANVMLIGGTPSLLQDSATTDLGRLSESLDSLRPNANPASLSDSLRESLSALSSMTHAAREVVFVSDFQSSDWQDSSIVSDLLATLEEQPASSRPGLTLFAVGQSQPQATNVAVKSVTASSNILALDQRATIRATIKNFGNTDQSDIDVEFKVDGESVRSTRVRVPAGQEVQSLFSHAFDSPGTHLVEVVTDCDPIKADNRCLAVFSVRRELPVALIDGSPGLRPLEGDTSFLELALQPHRESRSELKDLITTSTLEYRQLNDALLQKSRVCVLANVPKVHLGMLSRVKEFVKRGGGLLIFSGDAVDTQWYNEQLFENGKGLLPMPLESAQGPSLGGGTGNRATIADQYFEHPALEFFNQQQNGGMTGINFHRWMRLSLTAEASPEARTSVENECQVIAKLSSGDPWMVEKAYGRGRIIQVATPADADWGNIPALPVYVPLVQRLVVYLASSVEPPNNLQPGETLISLQPQHFINRKARLVDATGTEHQRKVIGEGRQGRIEFKDTQHPGVYQVTAPDGEVETFVVNLSREESTAKCLSRNELSQIAKELDADIITSIAEYQRLDRKRRFGTGIWKPLLWVLLAFLFLEILCQQWISNRRLT